MTFYTFVQYPFLFREVIFVEKIARGMQIYNCKLTHPFHAIVDIILYVIHRLYYSITNILYDILANVTCNLTTTINVFFI